MAGDQRYGLQSHSAALLASDRGVVQAGTALEVGQIADPMGECGKGTQPKVGIEGGAPVLIEGAQQHGHAASEEHRGLAEEAVGAKGLHLLGGRQGGVTLAQAGADAHSHPLAGAFRGAARGQ